MKRTPRVSWMCCLAVGVILPVFGSCLPENYFALSTRAIAVNIADSIVQQAVSPIVGALGQVGEVPGTVTP